MGSSLQRGGAYLPITVVQGEDYDSGPITYKNAAGLVIKLTGYTYSCQVRKAGGETLVMTPTVGHGAYTVNGTGTIGSAWNAGAGRATITGTNTLFLTELISLDPTYTNDYITYTNNAGQTQSHSLALSTGADENLALSFTTNTSATNIGPFNPTTTTAPAPFTITYGNGALRGVFKITIPSATTAAAAFGTYQYDLFGTVGGVKRQLLYGPFIVAPRISS